MSLAPSAPGLRRAEVAAAPLAGVDVGVSYDWTCVGEAPPDRKLEKYRTRPRPGSSMRKGPASFAALFTSQRMVTGRADALAEDGVEWLAALVKSYQCFYTAAHDYGSARHRYGIS